MKTYIPIFVGILLLQGCGSEDGGAGDARPLVPTGEDVSSPDMDDTGPPSPRGLDAAGDVEHSDRHRSDMDSGQPICSVGDRVGECIPTDACPDGHSSIPGHCPGPANIQCCVRDIRDDTCDPDARAQPNLGLVEVAFSPGCPPGMVAASDFCIDRYEATLVERRSDGSEVAWSPFFPPLGADVRAVSVQGAVPQGYISQNEATEACARSNKRLCTDDEWLAACQAATSQTYPYGDSHRPGACNDARPGHPAIDYFGPDDPDVWSKLGHPCINQQANTVARTGSFEDCVGATGAFDMVGNLHEWTSNPGGVFRGGFYADAVRNGPGCLYRTGAHAPAYWDYSTGFRCCFTP